MTLRLAFVGRWLAENTVRGVGHSAYRGLVITNGKVCVDLFGVTQEAK